MPTISMFYGIIIRMYFAPGEHPPPHFHVYYAEHTATIGIKTCEYNNYNKMYHSIKNVIPDENYVLSIMFANNEIATLDMKPYLDFGVFKRIKDYQQFKKVCISFDTIAWPSVGIDLDPEFVYQKCNRFNSVI